MSRKEAKERVAFLSYLIVKNTLNNYEGFYPANSTSKDMELLEQELDDMLHLLYIRAGNAISTQRELLQKQLDLLENIRC